MRSQRNEIFQNDEMFDRSMVNWSINDKISIFVYIQWTNQFHLQKKKKYRTSKANKPNKSEFKRILNVHFIYRSFCKQRIVFFRSFGWYYDYSFIESFMNKYFPKKKKKKNSYNNQFTDLRRFHSVYFYGHFCNSNIPNLC